MKYMTSLAYRSYYGTRKNSKAKEIMSAIGQGALLLICADVFILFMSLGQLAIEGQTGYWSPFWLAQAKIVLALVGA